MQIAAIQMPVEDGNPKCNRLTLAALLDTADGADLCLAPELWSSGYVLEQWSDIADSDTPSTMSWMANQAQTRQIWLGGSLISRDDVGNLRNRFILFDRNGNLACHYDKSHLFVPLDEHKWLKAGELLPPIVDVEGIKMAPTICYDLRFPETFRHLALAGVEVFLAVAEWPKPRQRALCILAEARAIENLAYLVLANRIGPDNSGTDFCGESAVFGPTGLISTMEEVVGVSSAIIDIKKTRELRENFPVLKHRLQGIDYD